MLYAKVFQVFLMTQSTLIMHCEEIDRPPNSASGPLPRLELAAQLLPAQRRRRVAVERLAASDAEQAAQLDDAALVGQRPLKPMLGLEECLEGRLAAFDRGFSGIVPRAGRVAIALD